MSFAFLITSVVVVLSLMLLSCSDEDCPICPKEEDVEPYRGWLYYVDQTAWSYDLYKVDTETDSIVDSLKNEGGYIPGLLAASSDGRYLAMAFSYPLELGGVTRILDGQSLGLIHEIPMLGFYFFDEEDDLFLLGRSGLVTGFDVPTFGEAFTDTLEGLATIEIDREANRLYCTSEFDWPIVVYDYLDHQVVDSIYLLLSPDDTALAVGLRLDASSSKLFFSAFTRTGSTFGCYNLVSDDVEFSHPIGTPFGDIGVSPDGLEVYLTDPGHSLFDWNSGTIYVFDATTGDYLEGISLYGYLQLSRALSATRIVFTPTGQRAYVGSGLVPVNIKGTGAVIVVDTRDRRITRLIPSETGSLIQYLAICPKLTGGALPEPEQKTTMPF